MNTFSGEPVLPLFQVRRGGMWTALAFLMVSMMPGKARETCLVVGLTLAVFLASGVVFPNPFMPAMVRQGHLYELSSSMMTFGIIAGWVWTRPAMQPESEMSAQNLTHLGGEAK